MNQEKTISPLQLFVILVNTAFGAGMLTLPAVLAEFAQEDMWLPVPLGGGLMLFSFWAATKLAGHFPGKTWVDYHPLILGRFFGQAVNIVLLFLMLMIAAVALRTFSGALKTFLLDLTPMEVIIAFFLILAVYSSQYGLATVMRMQQFIFLPAYGLFIMVILLGLLTVERRFYFPILAGGLVPVIKGVLPCWFAFAGPEVVIGLIYSRVTKLKSVMASGVLAIGVLTIIYLTITLIIQGALGPRDTAYQVMPTVIAYRDVEIPDTFIERLDGYVMMLWIAIYFNSLANFIYFISFGVGKVLNTEYNRPITVLLVPLVYYFTVLGPDLPTVSIIDKWTNLASIAWGIMILPLLLLAVWMQKRRGLC